MHITVSRRCVPIGKLEVDSVEHVQSARVEERHRRIGCNHEQADLGTTVDHASWLPVISMIVSETYVPMTLVPALIRFEAHPECD